MSASAISEPGKSAVTADERTWGMLAHLSALAGLVVPFGHMIGPLLIWKSRRERSAFVGEQAKEALNFNITLTLGALACYALTWLLVGIPLFIALTLYWMVMTVVAASKASEGVRYRHPVAMRLIA